VSLPSQQISTAQRCLVASRPCDVDLLLRRTHDLAARREVVTFPAIGAIADERYSPFRR
jgi:hypothetical protein